MSQRDVVSTLKYAIKRRIFPSSSHYTWYCGHTLPSLSRLLRKFRKCFFAISKKLSLNRYFGGMDIFFSHKTALEDWQKYRQGAIAETRPVRARPPSTPPDTRGLRIDTSLGLTKPLHILVENANARKVSKGIVSHYWAGPFTRGCFFESADGYLVSSPELCFLQMAGQLSFTRLIKLAYEFCGTYVLNPESPKGFDVCEPLTTVAKLLSFLRKMKGVHGIKRALRVLKYTKDQAASPMETVVTLCLTLPYRLGGYGFAAPKLNARIEPNRLTRGTANKQCYYCDLYWHEARFAVEYDSNAHHTGADRIANDSVRRNTLALMGIKVVSVTSRQINSREETRKLALLLSKYLDKPLQYQEPEFTRRCIELRKELFSGSF